MKTLAPKRGWRICAAVLALMGALAGFALAQEKGKPVRKAAPASREAARPSREAAATLVVFNRKDPSSEDLAKYYANKRGIPSAHVVGLSCSRQEEITRDQYVREIATPLRTMFAKNRWWQIQAPRPPLGPIASTRIRFVALMRGIPLRIAPAANYPGDQPNGPEPIASRNDAAVDSELAALGFVSRGFSGALNNPYHRGLTPILDAQFPEMLLVCRLDAPTPEMVKRMINDAILTEEAGLEGSAYIDARNIQDRGLIEGDKWLYQIAEDARKHGMPVILDNEEAMFPDGYPVTQAAFYFGWYAENVSGPFAQPGFRFNRGAVAAHIHSFSAATLRDPKRGWAAPLLAAGAAATTGNVYEPYLTLTPNLDVLHERLRAGFTFAESAWMSVRVTSWMTTFVGDPLYRPFQRQQRLEKTGKGDGPEASRFVTQASRRASSL